MTDFVSEPEWRFWLGDMPMPKDATPEMLDAARQVVENMEKQDEAAENIAYFMESLRHYEGKLEEAKKEGQPTETLESIIRTENEIIDTYRSWLV